MFEIQRRSVATEFYVADMRDVDQRDLTYGVVLDY
jgi:hypothetical protein